MGKHSEKNIKNKKKFLLIIPVILFILLIIILIFPKEIGYAIGWLIGSIVAIFK